MRRQGGELRSPAPAEAHPAAVLHRAIATHAWCFARFKCHVLQRMCDMAEHLMQVKHLIRPQDVVYVVGANLRRTQWPASPPDC